MVGIPSGSFWMGGEAETDEQPVHTVRLSRPFWIGRNMVTQAQWEYAAKAGEDYEYAGSDDPDTVAWSADNAEGEPHAVAGLAPGAWDVYDLSGNVWEWTGDGYDEDYYAQSPEENPPGSSTTSSRVLRGGSWNDAPANVRVANRDGNSPDYRGGKLGFRLARVGF